MNKDEIQKLIKKHERAMIEIEVRSDTYFEFDHFLEAKKEFFIREQRIKDFLIREGVLDGDGNWRE